MREVVGQFSAHQRVRGLSQRTIDRRTWSLGLWIDFLETRHRRLTEATDEDLERFLGRYPVAQTRHSLRSDIHQLYKWMVRRGAAEVDPTMSVDPPRIPKRSATPIPPEEVTRAIACATRRVRLMIMIAAYTGLRVSEIGRLRGEDIHLRSRMLIVRSGKGDKDGEVPLAKELVDELRYWPRTGPLFGVKGSTVSDNIREHLRACGIAGRPHDLRHSFGTQCAVKTNGNLALVAKLMRHDSIQNTQRYVNWHTTGQEVVDGLYDDEAA